MRKVIYTAIIGDYDRLHPIPEACAEGWEKVCFTDRERLESAGWNLAPVSPNGIPAVALARKIKILSHRFLSGADLSIWIDANIRILSPLDELVEGHRQDEPTLFRHWSRDCVYREIAACIKKRKADPVQLKWQMKKYRKRGFPAHAGLAMTGFLLRSGNERIAAMNESWWAFMERFRTWRDQLTLPLVLQGLGYPARLISGDLFGKYFEVLPHGGSS